MAIFSSASAEYLEPWLRQEGAAKKGPGADVRAAQALAKQKSLEKSSKRYKLPLGELTMFTPAAGVAACGGPAARSVPGGPPGPDRGSPFPDHHPRRAPRLIGRIRSNPLFRALRVDKLIYSVLESTLLAYVRQQFEAIPALRLLNLTAGELLARARALAAQLDASCRGRALAEVVACGSVVGGGAAPGWELPSHGVAVTISGLGADELLARLRGHQPPVIARVEHGRVVLDMRTVLPGEEGEIVTALKSACGAS